MERRQFSKLALDPAILKALAEQGYQQATDIQLHAIPEALKGRDLLAIAQTGTGKTAAFALPLLHRLHHQPSGGGRQLRALILTPTRELALQVNESLRAYGRHLPLKTTVVLGGVSPHAQIVALKNRPDILVATPGRLLDLFAQGHMRLNLVEILVLDEADRMLDMGFIPDVRKIVAQLPDRRQTLFFSATMPDEVLKLAGNLLRQPVRVEVAPSASVVKEIEQRVLFVDSGNKLALLADLLARPEAHRVLVFARTKHRANRVARQLEQYRVRAEVMHSDKTQSARQRALDNFARGKARVLVATDIVSRGIDVEGITHVVNYDLADLPENHVHRIGRTARAGAHGIALSFCDAAEVQKLRAIEKLSKQHLSVDSSHPFHSEAAASTQGKKTSQGHGSTSGASKPQKHHGRGTRQGSGRHRPAKTTRAGQDQRPQAHQHSRKRRSGSRHRGMKSSGGSH